LNTETLTVYHISETLCTTMMQRLLFASLCALGATDPSPIGGDSWNLTHTSALAATGHWDTLWFPSLNGGEPQQIVWSGRYDIINQCLEKDEVSTHKDLKKDFPLSFQKLRQCRKHESCLQQEVQDCRKRYVDNCPTDSELKMRAEGKLVSCCLWILCGEEIESSED